MRQTIFTLLFLFLTTASSAQVPFGHTPPLHVEGNQLCDPHGNRVVLHGVMDTPNPYFNGWRWGYNATDDRIDACMGYFEKLFTAITDTTQGAFANVFRLHLDPCWTNDPAKVSDGKESGEADISRFSADRLDKYLRTLYFPLARRALAHGMYVVMRPPGVCPKTVQAGGEYQQYLMTVWDIVSRNDSVRKYAGQLSLELANEPVQVLDSTGQETPKALHQFFQPIVDKIRANGFTGIIWVAGSGWQSNYRGFATYPIRGYNIGYAVHDYPGWYGTSDSQADAQNKIKQFSDAVPVVDTNPILITEVDWSPEKPGAGHYNEHGDWVPSNYGTWATATTSRWGQAYKDMLDHFGNISMTLSGTGCYIDIDSYVASGKVQPAFPGVAEACGEACFKWYRDYAAKDYPMPAYSRGYTADRGDGTFVNPIVNADFPDPDVIRVGDTYYYASTTMFHFPGITLLKSYDLVNWQYCANPLLQINSSDAYNLLNGQNHYSKGQWAPSLRYHDGKFYLNFIAFGDDGGDFMLTATDPEGEWEMQKLEGFYYDSGLLFDDGPSGDGNIYVASGIGDITVTRLSADFKALESQKVISVGNGCEGSHMYHIGDYYYIYATYGGTEGSQTIFRAKSPMGPYEEHPTRVFANQHIHQGALVETQTGEWWTVLFKDDGAIGRVPYLEPVVWKDGWPVIGNDGIDVSKDGTPYRKPNVGKAYPAATLTSNDTFTGAVLDKMWQWNHNADAAAWSLFDRPGWLRLSTTGTASDLTQARNSLTTRILGYAPAGTAADKVPDSYGTVKMDVSGMADGDVAGLAVFQDPYAYIGVSRENGRCRLVALRSAYDDNGRTVAAELQEGPYLDSEVVYLRARANFGSSTATFYYSTDNATWHAFGPVLKMRYTLKVFVGNRFYLFNQATKANGGHVDIDWFSTEPDFTEEDYYAPGTLKQYSKADLTLADLEVSATSMTLLPNERQMLGVTLVSESGLKTNVVGSCIFTSTNPEVARVEGGAVVAGGAAGSATIGVSYADVFGNARTLEVAVKVTPFPLVEGKFNPSIWTTGEFRSSDGYLKTGQWGFGGWQYAAPLDISAYNYLVVRMRQAAGVYSSFRLFDQNSYWTSPAVYDLTGKQEVVVDLHGMVAEKGGAVDPSHIYIAGFWSSGEGPLYIGDVFLSNDGKTAVTAVAGLRPNGEQQVVKTDYFDLGGRQVVRLLDSGVTLVRQQMADGTVRTVKVVR